MTALQFPPPAGTAAQRECANAGSVLTANADSALTAVELANAANERKHWLTLQARAALAGYELVLMADGSAVITRWGLLKCLPDAAAVEKFLIRAGAPA